MPGIVFAPRNGTLSRKSDRSRRPLLMVIDIVPESDKTATERARRLVDGHDVELWQGDRQSRAAQARRTMGVRRSTLVFSDFAFVPCAAFQHTVADILFEATS
jgi:hypothetical protein